MEETTTPIPAEQNPPSKIPGFRNVCFRLGIMMIIIFLSRAAEAVILTLAIDWFKSLDGDLAYLLDTILSFLFLYIIPMVCTALLLKPNGMCGKIYRKPEYFSNAMGMLPAMYGAVLIVNMLTMLVIRLVQNLDLYKSLNPVNDLQPNTITSACILLFQCVVIAPIFEEFWFRGMVMESLRPYGNGFAIFVSALLFGLTHANFNQFFYATLMGIFLGYIAISTKSIVTTTIMHAVFNSIAGLMMLFLSFRDIQDYIMTVLSGMEGVQTPAVTAYLIFCFLVIILMMVGVIMAIVKLTKIRRYKVPKVWTELSSGKRWGIFMSRATVIIALLLAADTFTFQMIPKSLAKLLT